MPAFYIKLNFVFFKKIIGINTKRHQQQNVPQSHPSVPEQSVPNHYVRPPQSTRRRRTCSRPADTRCSRRRKTLRNRSHCATAHDDTRARPAPSQPRVCTCPCQRRTRLCCTRCRRRSPSRPYSRSLASRGR